MVAKKSEKREKNYRHILEEIFVKSVFCVAINERVFRKPTVTSTLIRQ